MKKKSVSESTSVSTSKSTTDYLSVPEIVEENEGKYFAITFIIAVLFTVTVLFIIPYIVVSFIL